MPNPPAAPTSATNYYPSALPQAYGLGEGSYYDTSGYGKWSVRGMPAPPLQPPPYYQVPPPAQTMYPVDYNQREYYF